MNSKSAEPWYLHAALYTIIAILIFVLIKVAIIDPQNVVELENYNRKESRLRMKNLKEAEILWQKKHNYFTASLDSLVNFVKTSAYVDSVMHATDTLTHKSANPFLALSNGKFTPDSLFRTPGSDKPYILEVDTTISADTVVNRYGKVTRIDTVKQIGTMYYIEDPDGYGTVGSTTNQALLNTVSWE